MPAAAGCSRCSRCSHRWPRCSRRFVAPGGHRQRPPSRCRQDAVADKVAWTISSTTSTLAGITSAPLDRPTSVAMSKSVADREDGQADREDPGDQGREQHLVRWGDASRVGVGGEVLAPAAVVDVGAQPAEEEPRGVRALREVERDVDRVGVPQRDPEDREDLREQPERLRVLGVGPLGARVGRQVLVVRAEVLDVDPDPADPVVVELERDLAVGVVAVDVGLGPEQQPRVLDLDATPAAGLPRASETAGPGGSTPWGWTQVCVEAAGSCSSGLSITAPRLAVLRTSRIPEITALLASRGSSDRR